MALEILQTARVTGPALPEPFVRFELEGELTRLRLLPKSSGEEGRILRESWDAYRRRLRELVASGGPIRVRNQVLEPLVQRLGYERLEPAPDVQTREGRESGGYWMIATNGSKFRVWAVGLDEDLDAPARRGRAYRFSHVRVAQRVLLAAGERAGVITNGIELRLLLSDPARPDSQIEFSLDPHWKRSREVPDTYRVLLALACPRGLAELPQILDKARLQQTRVTRELRVQARQAVELFVQTLLDLPANHELFEQVEDRQQLARDLWHEGLIVVYRLLFILKLESSDDPARSFSFASTSLWRNSFSPSIALARHARAVLDRHAETGTLLEDGLQSLFRMFSDGLQCTELNVRPLGGTLFGTYATPLLSRLRWGERGVAYLLDRLLWTPRQRGADARERVHYGTLDVEDLGRVYEALLELSPGLAKEPMCRLRRQKLEVVVPSAQGERYRPAQPDAANDSESNDADAPDEDVEESASARSRQVKVEWIEEIPAGRFYLRVGLGRKASGSFYTPHSFVRFLVQETLGPRVARVSTPAAPDPSAILGLKVLDSAMGSGHFLVEACRFLGEKLYEACRLCDEKASEIERRSDKASSAAEKEGMLAEAIGWRRRVEDLPDPDDELASYLPSRAPEREASGYSQKRAEALCKRLVAVHCLYGVDLNPLAVELAKLALWLECHNEGMPLTFLDHRLVLGNSTTGPFFEHLLTFPGSREPLADLFCDGLRESLTATLATALAEIRALDASVGATIADEAGKRAIKARLDGVLSPFRMLAAAWSGGVQLGREACDDGAYLQLARCVATGVDIPPLLGRSPALAAMVDQGLDALPYDLLFPEAFYPAGNPVVRGGFDTVLGNPPWDAIRRNDDEFFANVDFAAVAGTTKSEKTVVHEELLAGPAVKQAYESYKNRFTAIDRIIDAMFAVHKAKVNGELAGRGTYDYYMIFAERAVQLSGTGGLIGLVLPSAFHALEGATGLRRLYFESITTRMCYSFENKRRIFDIHSSYKFALVVAENVLIDVSPTGGFKCAFYLKDESWLFLNRGQTELKYSLDFVRRTGGEYLNLLELRSAKDASIANTLFQNSKSFQAIAAELRVKLSQELNMTYDVDCFTPVAQLCDERADARDPETATALLEQGYLPLHEGKTFWQFDDRWGARPRYLVNLARLGNRAWRSTNASYFRLAFRDVASATNERTVVFTILPPAFCGNTAPAEQTPDGRPTANALLLAALANTFVVDWSVRLRAASHVNLFLMNAARLPSNVSLRSFLIHASLRLVCNHDGFRALWLEQVGRVWREPAVQSLVFPVIEDIDCRWDLAAACDALVAEAVGFSEDEYTYVLDSFSNSIYPKAMEKCIGRFRQLKQVGTAKFMRTIDPYWDIAVSDALPKPAIAANRLDASAVDIPQGEMAFGAPAANIHTRRPRPKSR